MNREHINREWFNRTIKSFLDIKLQQRIDEERLVDILSKPIYRKWLDERVQAQYKHERVLKQMIEYEQLDEDQDEAKGFKKELDLIASLEEVERNIDLLNDIMHSVLDFEVYKELDSIRSDEYMYYNKLIMICNNI